MTCPAAGATFDPLAFTSGPPLDEKGKEDCKRCDAVVKAFSAFPCSGRQEEFVGGGEFRVCQSACDELFNACGKPTHRGGKLVAARCATYKGGGGGTSETY